ncbi:MAG: hypothetical protein WD032_00160 [Nitrospirales bacterium]
MRRAVNDSILWLAAFSLAIIMIPESGNAQQKALQANTEERRELCMKFVDNGLTMYDSLAGELEVEQLVKIWETGTTNQNLLFLMTVVAEIADQYHRTARNRTNFQIDMLHTCVTNTGTLDTTFLKLWLSKIPTDHPQYAINMWLASMTPEKMEDLNLVAEQSGEDGKDFNNSDQSILGSKAFRAMLGEEFEGTQKVAAYTNRNSGRITGCGLEFSHIHYDHIYSMGVPVKISGSINLLEHPVAILAGVTKIKGENFSFSVNPNGTPNLQLSVFKIDDAYLSADTGPIIADNQLMECEDKDYHCRINFQWDKHAEAIMQNMTSLSYRPAEGNSDVLIRIDWDNAEGGPEQINKFGLCLLDLTANASGIIKEN